MFEFHNICRLCTQNINIKYNLNNSLINKLTSLAPNAHQANDNLPQFICEVCNEKLNQSYSFQRQILNCYKILTSFLVHVQNVETNKGQNGNVKNESYDYSGDETIISDEFKRILNNLIIHKQENSFDEQECEESVINFEYDHFINNAEIKVEDNKTGAETVNKNAEASMKKKRGRPRKKELKDKKDETNVTENVIETTNDDTDYDYLDDINFSDDSNDSSFELQKVNVKTTKTKLKKKKVTRNGSIQSDLDPNEYTYQLPYDSSVKITYISNVTDKFFFCKSCNKQYADFSSLRKHFVHHSTIKIFQCDLCEYETFTKRCLVSHKIVHIDVRTETCKECGKTFKSKDRLHRHMYCHTKRFICDKCGKEFSHSAMLRKHVTNVHVGERNSICNVCGFAAKSQEYLNRHMNKHDDSDKNKIKCPICKRLLKTRNSFKIHMRRHTDDRKFACTLCDKKYVVKSQLDIHFRIHTGYKPFTCSFCGKQFRKADPFKNHLRIHTNERPFVCEFCKKGFKQKVSLQVHLRLHTGERPYVCKDCSKSFIQSSVYKLHMKKYHLNTFDN